MYLPKFLISFINALYIGFQTLIRFYEVQHLQLYHFFAHINTKTVVRPNGAQWLWALLLN